MIRAENIHKSFGSLEVLKGIDLHIPPKSVVSITGASGAGKTTLLQILGTLTRPDSGSVFLNGRDISGLRSGEVDSLRNRQIGFVFQFHNLFPEFTALENVCIPAFIAGTPKRTAEQKALELLGFLGLSERVHHKPGELSGGEQQRVAVARALINDPLVVFADEPSGNLDSVNKEELHRLFFTLRDTYGKTFVIVTHDHHLAEMSDCKLVMSDGKMI
jgi:lipoprotein-releasing system ATP-binding protein